MASTLMAHCGGQLRTRDALASIPTPQSTPTWTPVPHADLVGSLIDNLERQGIGVVRDQYATAGKGDVKLFGVLDLRIDGLDTPEFGMSLGLRGANDKSMAISVIAAARVFVCDNMAFSGSDGSVCLHKKHTGRLDLAACVPPAIDAFLEKAGAFRVDIDQMRNTGVTDFRAKEIIFDSFAGSNRVAPLRLLPEVARLYFEDDEQRGRHPDRTLWGLNQAYTEAVKALRPVVQHRCGPKIGKLFGRILHGNRRQIDPVFVDGINALVN